MNKNALRIVVLILSLGVLGYGVYDEVLKEEVIEDPILSLEEKLEEASFVLNDDYYIREVTQDQTIYEEILNLEEDKFVRITEDGSDKEVFSYNYETDKFNYLYYFDGELINTFVYSYKDEVAEVDEGDLFEALEKEISALKGYFEDLLNSEDILVKEL